MRKIIFILVCSTAVLLSGYAGYRGYKVWKQSHMMTLAQEYISKSDLKNAMLCLAQVLQSNPRHLEASRMMAAYCESTHSPNALLWRSRVLELNPRSIADRLALVGAAMSANDMETAANALAGVDPAGRTTPEFHRMAGVLATATGNMKDAEFHFAEMSRLRPQDPIPQLNLAVLHLASTNRNTVAEARAILNVLSLNSTNSALRCQALRELVSEASRNQNFDSALALSAQLIEETNSLFSDRLTQLAAFKAAKRPEFDSALAACQREAVASPGKTCELASWQMAKMSPADALAWMKTLSPSVQTNQPVALLIAECRESMGDWPGLESTLAKQRWGDLECIRLALRSRSLRGLEMDSAARLEWTQALKAANGQKQPLITLLRLAIQWHWVSDSEEILCTLVERFPGEDWASRALMQSYLQSGQTRSLLTLCGKLLAKSPSNVLLKNNLAMIGLLLDARENQSPCAGP